MAAHVVKKASAMEYRTPAEFVGHSTGYSGDDVVDEAAGAVQMGFRVARLEPGGSVDSHVHSWEESIYVTSGSLTVDTSEGSVELVTGDYGLLPVGSTHAFRNTSAEAGDVLGDEGAAPAGALRLRHPLPASRSPPGTARAIDVRDPRNRYFGHIDPESMDPANQTQDRLQVSASMRTALLVYSGISVKMMVDSDLGATLSTMFMVQYEQGGFAGAHDHPLEEMYQILDGEVEAFFDGSAYQLGRRRRGLGRCRLRPRVPQHRLGTRALAGDAGAATAAPPLLPLRPRLALPRRRPDALRRTTRSGTVDDRTG